MEKEKEFKYEIYNQEIKEEDIIKEEAFAYGVKEQGEYTLEDYYALPDDVRVELIDGVFYEMLAPGTTHQDVSTEIEYVLKDYIVKNHGKCKLLHAPIDVQLDCDDRTMLQPDIIILCDRTKMIERCIFGAPDFVIEILSPSTRKKDMIIKLAKYKNAGVKEYWMIDIEKRRILVYNWKQEEVMTIYGLEDKVPVDIWDGRCEVDFKEIMNQTTESQENLLL